ncbi:hypothetical protein [Loktanella sp. Alg231-35]|nr:hypothetical protein [Loktanella sp. Alg231-35]
MQRLRCYCGGTSSNAGRDMRLIDTKETLEMALDAGPEENVAVDRFL